jgi:hypothetical protein
VNLLRGRPVEELLIEAAEGADLLVLAGSAWARRGSPGIDPMAGRIATSAPCAVLLVTPAPLLVWRRASVDRAAPFGVEADEALVAAAA